jgi:hypothetical protein
VTAQATDRSAPVFDVVLTEVPSTTFQLSAIALFVEIHQPPDLRLNLPLLI